MYYGSRGANLKGWRKTIEPKWIRMIMLRLLLVLLLLLLLPGLIVDVYVQNPPLF